MKSLFLLSAVSASFIFVACSTNIEATDPNGRGGTDDEFADRPDAAGVPSCDEVRPIAVSEAQPPDLLLVVDKSGSMDDDINGDQKWGTMRTALGTTLGQNANSINFGLMLYPTDDECGSGTINAPIATGNSSSLISALSGVDPEGGTPTHTSLQSALTYFQGLEVNPNGRFVLLATDGEPNCPNDGSDSPTVTESVSAITALKTAGIPTFVLGFGNGVNTGTLQAMAQAGGQGQYLAANSPAQLAMALAEIANAVALAECSFSLGEVPEDPTRLRLFFDGDEVGRSTQHAEGWDYDEASNTVTIYGGSCDTLQGGGVTEVKVDYGCEGTSID